MIKTKIQTSISIGINKQQIKLQTKDRKIFFREIIYPIGEKISDIKKYIKDSMPQIDSVELLRSEIGLCFLNLSPKNDFLESTNLIDKYWVDGESYLIDYKSNGENNYLFIVIDSNLDKDKIINSLKGNEISNEVLFVDQLSDCWIKRQMYSK